MKFFISLFNGRSMLSINAVEDRPLSETLERDDFFRNLRKLLTLATIIIPSLGFIVTIQQILFSRIGFLEIGLLVGMYILTIIGVELGFHRHFSHHAFQVHDSTRVILAILGSMAAQGPLIYWVSYHRCHHQFSDRVGDPHSPYISDENCTQNLRDMRHAHLGWLLMNTLPNSILYAKDLLRNSLIARINQMYMVWVILGLVIPSILGGWITWTWHGVYQGFLWGGLARIFLVHHAVWSVNSFAHVYGHRPFKTDDCSTNNLWLVLPSLGGAWHNNHHAFPTAASNAIERWQVDPGGWIVWGFEKLGLVWNVSKPTGKMMAAKKR
jgi:stearoyl-CoA desaturase (Delta-9 desaturase)